MKRAPRGSYLNKLATEAERATELKNQAEAQASAAISRATRAESERDCAVIDYERIRASYADYSLWRASASDPDGSPDEYQRQALRTAAGTGFDDLGLAIFGLGIAGEAGEVADYLKKVIGHGHALDKEKLQKELGDVLWYVAVIAHAKGLLLSEVMEANIKKLRKRYPDGFSSERSVNRSEAK